MTIDLPYIKATDTRDKIFSASRFAKAYFSNSPSDLFILVILDYNANIERISTRALCGQSLRPSIRLVSSNFCGSLSK